MPGDAAPAGVTEGPAGALGGPAMGGSPTRRLTVLRIIDRLNVGGPAIHAVLTAKGLDRERFRTVLVVGSVEPGEADMSYLLEASGIECVVIPSLGRELRPLRDVETAWRLWRVMRRERPDVVHTHKAKAGALGRALAALLGVPVVVHTFHGHVLRGYFGPAKTRLFRALEQGLARLSSALVALSEGLVTELADELKVAPRQRFRVVPLGFDLAPFAACRPGQGGMETGTETGTGTLRRLIGVGPQARILAIIGRMVPIKDHHTFLAASAELVKVQTDAHFVFVGGGELEVSLRREAERLGLGGRAHFIGWQRDLAPLYADLDAVVLSSINEGTPVALIEAMASGVPVAATAVGGVPDLLRQGAWGELVPPRQPPALAAAMARALTSAARERARSIRSEVLEQFGGARLCRDLERLYLDLYSRRR